MAVKLFVVWVLLKSSIFGPAFVTDRHPGDEAVKGKVYEGDGNERQAVGPGDGHNPQEDNRDCHLPWKVFLQIKILGAAGAAKIDHFFPLTLHLLHLFLFPSPAGGEGAFVYSKIFPRMISSASSFENLKILNP